MKEAVSVWEETVVIPTYEAGKPDKNPMFLEKRVYQGSSGKVYPLPTIESISDEKVDKEYHAVYLENEYLKVMILPELGGRIQRAYDKTNGYDFVYYNEVIKPALVGLAGPWISGGIEFNWPQHHRPTTFSPVEYTLKENTDGSKSVLVSELDVMNGTKGMASFTLYPEKAYIEIKGQLYNRTSLPQTFLWWANPAVAVNDNTFSVFPPDVHAVYDHGKRDVSEFPIAKGVYYKMDYSKGVDISRYKNIPVPTSYMAYRSNYDFVGGYDEGVHAGILHIADHHISPGKKQWTWGCGDFGKAWDRNLTDANGPYIELMTGVFTDNQPDFTWLKPFEEKTFTQYFMPYKEVGMVKNAKLCGALGVEEQPEDGATKATITLYMTGIYHNLNVCVRSEGKELWSDTITHITPEQAWSKKISLDPSEQPYEYIILDEEGNQLLSYQADEGDKEIPGPAKPVKTPKEVESLEELYLIGMHLEQYRHATYDPQDYYLEGIRRDQSDIRLNTAYGTLLLRKGLFGEAKTYLNRAIGKLKHYNPNPYDSEAIYLAGLCEFYLGNYNSAYTFFRKAAWSKEQQENSFYYAASIKAMKHSYIEALQLVDQSLIRNSHNVKARGLRSSLLRVLGRREESISYTQETIAIDPFDYRSQYEWILAQELSEENRQVSLEKLSQRMEDKVNNYLELSMDYAEGGFYAEATKLCMLCQQNHPMIGYYLGYFYQQQGKSELCQEAWRRAAKAPSDYCFPNKLWEIRVLEAALKENPKDGFGWYYLGILWYDKKQYEKAMICYEQCVALKPQFPTVYRNMALYDYNKIRNFTKARQEMEKAFSLNPQDARVFLELDQLYKKLCVPVKERLANCEKHADLLTRRDDLYTEYITLLNLDGQYQKAYDCCMSHKFHPWEGGEGKISDQYVVSLLQLSKQILHKENPSAKELEQAIQNLSNAKEYPVNLGEGKLAGAKDNHLDYYLGCAYEKAGNQEQAMKYWQVAAAGKLELGNAMYYNDQPADRILFQGLALSKLGKEKEARQIIDTMIAYGREHKDDHLKIDYFAVSLPDFLIFDENLDQKNEVHCNYLIGLGRLGLGDKTGAREAFAVVRSLDCAHIGVAEFCEL